MKPANENGPRLASRPVDTGHSRASHLTDSEESASSTPEIVPIRTADCKENAT